MSTHIRRPDPEKLLKQIQAEEAYQQRGRLKIFLGYSSGVGKSHRMLDEGRRRKERGQDVVVGAIQPEVTPDVDRLLRKLEIIPLETVSGVAVMNVPLILRRYPAVCLVDGLAYDNPPGCAHAHRWEDVRELLNAGISVISTVNLQHIEERREEVQAITGKAVFFTVPLSFVKTADEIVVVDASAQTCLQREGESARSGPLADREQRLSKLREIALVLAADVVDYQLACYLERHGVEQSWGTQERILVVLVPGRNAAQIVASGQRNAARFHGELYIAQLTDPSAKPDEQAELEKILIAARNSGAHIHQLPKNDAVASILQFAYSRGITQIFVGHDGKMNWREHIHSSFLDRLVRSAAGIDIQVFPN